MSSVAEEFCRSLDIDFPRQAHGCECATDYQTGFDAGIREAKKELRHPNVQAAVLARLLSTPPPTESDKRAKRGTW